MDVAGSMLDVEMGEVMPATEKEGYERSWEKSGPRNDEVVGGRAGFFKLRPKGGLP